SGYSYNIRQESSAFTRSSSAPRNTHPRYAVEMDWDMNGTRNILLKYLTEGQALA
ncbi:4174_t:CDS:2, partial [Ambispora leptoticha]